MQRFDLSTCSWKFKAKGKSQWMPATVPGCVHKDLLNNGVIEDPFWGDNELGAQWIGFRDWEYTTSFFIPEGMYPEEHLDLCAEGLDTLASVYLNGQLVASTQNMFIGYRWDVRSLVKKGRNILRIVFSSAEEYVKTAHPDHKVPDRLDPVGRCTVIRKQQSQFGWDWGPRFVTAGIWRPIFIESWSGNRIESLCLTQDHRQGGWVRLRLDVSPKKTEKISVLAKLYFEGRLLEEKYSKVGASLVFEIKNPHLWWPAGQGEQPLYMVSVELLDKKTQKALDHCEKCIGLRTIKLDRHKDRWGETFQFLVNGRPIFAKGANWIPAHSFVAGLKRKDYERDLIAAVKANMNMIRVWGGGIYEDDSFYDICDELGLLVWQDFMFACTLYPHDDEFIKNVQLEAASQIRRIRHHACLALWCGNNELPQVNKQELKDEYLRNGYEKLFHKALPKVIEREDGTISYWPSSEWRGFFDSTHLDGEKYGDTHYWEVWHRRQPVKDYERWLFRFCSEFGMQSFSSLHTQTTFCPPERSNIFGRIMENHQKNRGGNQVMLDYISRRYCFPKDQEALIYLSQLNQAYCMSVGVEHFRRAMPRCMGALYWQLNDCWPVASWSSIEFTGRWKALHYAARRFFAPALISAHILQEEETTVGNYLKPGGGIVHLYTVCDLLDKKQSAAFIRWELCTIKVQGVIAHGRKQVRLEYGQSIRQKILNFQKQMDDYGSANLYLRIILELDSQIVSESTVLFTAPRFIDMPAAKTEIELKMLSAQEFDVTFISAHYQHQFMFDVDGMLVEADDNFFDLYPNCPKVVRVKLPAPLTEKQLSRRLRWRSLADSYYN